MSGSDGSGWRRAYREAPHVLHEFACAEDPDGLVAEAISKLISSSAGIHGSRMLELGCGTICMGALMARDFGAHWIGLDSAPAVAKAATSQLGLVCARAEQIPLKSQTVDFILATWMLSYMPPTALTQTLAECDRVLRPGGFILVAENGAHADGIPADGNVPRLLDAGFQEVAEIDTEMRFATAERAVEITRFLMGDLAPTPTAQGCIPHRVKLLRRSSR